MRNNIGSRTVPCGTLLNTLSQSWAGTICCDGLGSITKKVIYIYLYIYIYLSVCACVCACACVTWLKIKAIHCLIAFLTQESLLPLVRHFVASRINCCISPLHQISNSPSVNLESTGTKYTIINYLQVITYLFFVSTHLAVCSYTALIKL